MITAVGAIVHSSPQRADLVRFYREGLGLGDPDHLAGEDIFQVGDLRLGINSGEGRLRAPLPRLSLTFVVDDLDGQVQQLRSMGVPFDLEPTAEPSGARRAVCRDPDGNFVVLLSGPRLARALRPLAPPVAPPVATAKAPVGGGRRAPNAAKRPAAGRRPTAPTGRRPPAKAKVKAKKKK